MRPSAGEIANAVAWIVLLGLAVLAVLIANRLGFAGLFLLGAGTWFVCTIADLDQDAPTYGVETFRRRLNTGGSAEQRAAAAAERQAAVGPLRFYRRCGMALAIVGAAGFTWQQIRAP